MQGLNFVAAVLRRQPLAESNNLETVSVLSWKCDVQPLTLAPGVAVTPTLASSTHLAIGEKTPELQDGWVLVVNGTRYAIVEADMRWMHKVKHHQECFLVEAE